MAPVILVEVLDARGTVRARTRVTSLPAIVGRAPDCDVHLDDPYVCARHCSLALDDEGRPVIEDLGSVNGVRPWPYGPRVARLPLGGERHLRVGRTRLRVRSADAPVPPALVDRSGEDGAQTDTLPRAAALVAAAAVVGGLEWLGAYEDRSPAAVLGTVLALATFGLLWTALWAAATRVASHGFAFGRHYAVAGVGIAALVAFMELTEWLTHVAPGSAGPPVLAGAGAIALLSVLVAAHLGHVSPGARAVRWRWAGGVAAGLLVVSLMVAATPRDEDDPLLESPGAIRPVPTRWVRSEPLDAFVERLPALRARVDSLARADSLTAR